MDLALDFAPDETQEAVVRLAAEVLDGTGDDPPERVWKALAQAGLLALAVPPESGGAGLGVVETCLTLAEIGRRAVPVPALALALGVLPVARATDAAQRAALLSGVAAGDTLLTAAVREPGDPMPARPRTTAAPLVSGVKVGVPYASRAHRILVPVSVDGGTAVAIVDPADAGVTLHRTHSSTGDPEYTVRLDGVAAELLSGVTVADLYRCTLAATCATGAGALAGALDRTSAHVGSREQFGKPLATFQAVAQQVADVYVAARTTHLAALAAAWRLGTGRPADTDLSVAAYWLASQGPPAMRTCHHLHGGVGLDVSYPLHRYSALVTDLVRLIGGAEYRLGEVPCSST
ncbi:acyl-CoA dehydrogenase family protein [Phytohabitans aurantiacus]|uniref:Acyl-CoA dehydrogenase n=1 Tax=Phytohabitans aurantiacus TaxID=3016789 RepID=A0ABQ5R0L7_9ACTN|nr:acyl-CoA dehydrogenase family protein [Phytohabitans aurantiacus]GLH99494.1 acyl-CoA dehydrogenase [Phytohabitans aurantiacus]